MFFQKPLADTGFLGKDSTNSDRPWAVVQNEDARLWREDHAVFTASTSCRGSVIGGWDEGGWVSLQATKGPRVNSWSLKQAECVWFKVM